MPTNLSFPPSPDVSRVAERHPLGELAQWLAAWRVDGRELTYSPLSSNEAVSPDALV